VSVPVSAETYSPVTHHLKVTKTPQKLNCNIENSHGTLLAAITILFVTYISYLQK